MLVRNKTTGIEINVDKGIDGTYDVDGVKLSPEDMKAQFEIVKKVVAKKKQETEETNMLGTLLAETEHSETLGKLALALSKAQSEFVGVKKDSEGYGYSFADLNAVIKASAPIFTKHELAITQDTLGCMVDGIYYAGVKTMLIHSSGEWKSATGWIPTERSKQNPLVQMFGVNSTYFRRYQYQAILGLATTDNDGSDK